jgi:hypothetical protein
MNQGSSAQYIRHSLTLRGFTATIDYIVAESHWLTAGHRQTIFPAVLTFELFGPTRRQSPAVIPDRPVRYRRVGRDLVVLTVEITVAAHRIRQTRMPRRDMSGIMYETFNHAETEFLVETARWALIGFERRGQQQF